MSILLIILLLPAELSVIGWAIRRSGFLPFPHGIMLYLWTGQIMLILQAAGVLRYEFLRVYSTYAFIHHFNSMFLLMAGGLFALLVVVPASRVSIVATMRTMKVNDIVFWGLIVIFYLSWGITFTALRWDLVWNNSSYLTMTDPEMILNSDNAATRFAFGLTGPFGVLGWVALAFAVSTGRLRIAAVLAPVALWSLIYMLAAHSRVAAALIILAGLFMFLFPRQRWFAIPLVLVGLLTSLSVLWGRGSGHHGLSSIPEYFTNIVKYYDVAGIDAISNMYEGVFVTSEFFARIFRYPELYKILSLMPTFSFIDGYDQIRDIYSIRLAYQVPNSAVSEVLSFGPVYAAIYFGVQLIAGRMSARLIVLRPGLVTIGINALIFLGAYLQFTYDARSIFRIFVYCLVGCLVIQWQIKRGLGGTDLPASSQTAAHPYRAA